MQPRDTVLAEGDEVALIPPVSGGSFALSEQPLSLDDAVREVASDDAGAIATFTGTTRARSRGREVVQLEYEAYEGMAEAEMERIAGDLKERHSLIAVAIHHRVGVVRDRRDERRDRGLRSPSRGGARGLRRGDRHPQGHGAAVEEGDLRRRRGVDRAGLVSSDVPGGARAATQRQGLGRLIAPIAVAGAVLLKVAGSLKFLGIFVAVGGYALIWGWRFGVGFVLLILVHELGHYVEARRQGLNPQLPVFIPFLGAYVALRNQPFDPWRNALVSVAGPVAGGIGALACLVYGNAVDSDLLRALAYAGFFLNLVNLIPIGILDGGHILRSWRILRAGGGRASPAEARRLAGVVGAYSVAVAAALALGMVVAHIPQNRL